MKFILPCILCFFVTFSALAEEKFALVPYDFGIAMTGAPAQSKEDNHLSYANPNAPKGGTLKQAEIGTFDTVNPYAIKGKAASGLNLIYDKLMARSWDEPFTLYPLIAEKIEMPKDRGALIIHLNKAAKFNDGSPITAKDILFSFETLKEFGRPNMRRTYRQVETIEVINPHTVKMTFGADKTQETGMILAMMPVLSKSWWQGRNFEETLLEMPNSSGPYIIKDIQPGSKITYIRNPNYWAATGFAATGLYNFDEVSFTYFRDDNTAMESFLKGDIDLRRERDPRKWNEAYGKESIEKLELAHGRPQRVDAMIFNMRRPMFEDINVRKALYLAFDGNWIKQNFFEGTLKRTNSYFPNSLLSADKPIFGHDLDKRARLKTAQDLLQVAGWTINNNQLQKDGVPFQFEILLNQSKDEKIVLAFIQSLKRLGIQANVRTLDSATFQNRLLDYDYDMILHKWQNSLSPGTEQMVFWGCAAVKEPGRFNYAGVCREEIDEAAAAIANATSYEELTKHARTLDALLVSEYISIPLFYNNSDFIAVQKDRLGIPEKTSIYGAVLETWWAK